MTLLSARKQYWLFLHSDNNAIPLKSSPQSQIAAIRIKSASLLPHCTILPEESGRKISVSTSSAFCWSPPTRRPSPCPGKKENILIFWTFEHLIQILVPCSRPAHLNIIHQPSLSSQSPALICFLLNGFASHYSSYVCFLPDIFEAYKYLNPAWEYFRIRASSKTKIFLNPFFKTIKYQSLFVWFGLELPCFIPHLNTEIRTEKR